MTRRILLLLVLFAGFVSGRVVAQVPSEPRQPHPYDITPAAGPYAILVKSYSGETAKSLAYELVSELRRDYKLPAYFLNRSEEARQEEEQRLQAQRKMRMDFYKQYGYEPPEKVHVKRLARIEDQYAVLIAANYKDMDAARMDLDHIRKLKSPSEKLVDKNWLIKPAKDNKSSVETAPINPFLTAFVVPNPTVPRQRDVDQDKQEGISLREMNADESYSLIHKCPGKWTLVVKAYRGPTKLLSRESEKSVLERVGFGNGKSGSDYLGACARQAHQFAEVLRNKQLNFESYVLHTQSMSLVTVGSFNSEKDPRMVDLMGAIAKLQFLSPSGPAETLMNPPQPFQVPR